MATHSSVLAWRIPGTEEPGGLMRSHGVEHDWSDLAAGAATPNSWNPRPNSVPELILTVSQNKQISAREHTHIHTQAHTRQARLIDLVVKLLAGMMAFLKEKIDTELKCEAQCYVFSCLVLFSFQMLYLHMKPRIWNIHRSALCCMLLLSVF